MEKPYPDNCIKGIKSADSIIGGRAATHLFYFESKVREDGWREQSINWEDDYDAIDFTLRDQKTDGSLRFKFGVAMLPRTAIDTVNSYPASLHLLYYERQALEGNPYHGNILLDVGTPRHIEVAIAGGLALQVKEIRQAPTTGD